jgi:hypothetical protein
MTLRQYLLVMAVATLICWLIWVLVLFIYDPYAAGMVGFALFYTSLFLSILGTYSVIGFVVRIKILKKDEIVFRHIKHTFRQGMFFASFSIITLVLAQNQVLTWWNFSLLLVFFVFLEGLLFANRKYQNHDYVR